MSSFGSRKKELVKLWFLVVGTVLMFLGTYGSLLPWMISQRDHFLFAVGLFLSTIVGPVLFGLLAVEIVLRVKDLLK